MALIDLLGRRWVLRIVFELREGEILNFRELQQRCGGMSSSVLNQRLADLREAGIVESAPGGYRLTHEGRRMNEFFPPMEAWAARRARRVAARSIGRE